MSEIEKDFWKTVKDMKEGQSEWKRSQSTTWKDSEVDTFDFSVFLHLQIFHILRKLLAVFDVILFIIIN